MAIYALGDAVPSIDPSAFVHPDATVIGHVSIGAQPGAGVGAAALVTEDAVVPTGHIALGVPARPRPAPDLAEMVSYGVGEYLRAVSMYQHLRRIDDAPRPSSEEALV